MVGDILGYVAWGRDGSEHRASGPLTAAGKAWRTKAPGRARKPVLVMACKEGDVNFEGVAQEYCVPLGWWEPSE